MSSPHRDNGGRRVSFLIGGSLLISPAFLTPRRHFDPLPDNPADRMREGKRERIICLVYEDTPELTAYYVDFLDEDLSIE